jgi:hypothetical protein
MQPLVSMYNKDYLDKNEILFSRYGAHDLFLAQAKTGMALLTSKTRINAENSWGNVARQPVIDGDGVSIGDTRSCSIADTENTSHLIELDFTPYTWGWTMYPSMYSTRAQAINYVDYGNDFTVKANRYTLALMTTVDTAARNVVETAKNVYFPSNITNYYPNVGDALQVSQADKDDCFNQLQAIMTEYDFYNTTMILGSPSLKPITARLSNQRTGNATNQSFQFDMGDFRWTNSNRITNGSGVAATFYAIQEGNLDIVNRNNPDARANRIIGAAGSPVTEWGTMVYPRLGMTVGTFFRQDCSDQSGNIVPNSATLKESFGFDTEISWITPYNSSPTTKQTPIIKVEISAS